MWNLEILKYILPMWNMVNCYNIPVVPGTTVGIGGGNSQKEEPTYEKAHISWSSKRSQSG